MQSAWRSDMSLPKLDYVVIGSGSSGNAVRIWDIMVDCGLAYARLKDELPKCKILFITHIHSDHLNMRTYQQIKAHYPGIKVFGNREVAAKIDVDYLVTAEPFTFRKQWVLTPFEVPHNVLTHGFTLHTKNGADAIYVADSAGTRTWPDEQFDYMFIESNHDETIVNQVKNADYGYDVFQNAKRHTSKQESRQYFYTHRKTVEAEWIQLHKSKRFY